VPATHEAASLTEAYRSGLLAARAFLLLQLNHAWAGLIDPDQIAETWPAFAGIAAAATSSVQSRLAGAAVNYVAEFVAASLGTPVKKVALDDASYAGLTSAGRPLPDVLGGFPPVLLKQIADGRPVDDAMTAGQAVVNRLCGSSALDAGRAALDDAMSGDRHVRGRYHRVTSARCCIFCAALADRGDVYHAGTVGFLAHPHCSCSGEPVVTGGDALVRQHPPIPADAPSQQDIDAFWSRFNARAKAQRAANR
jgi:hypothetical protein